MSRISTRIVLPVLTGIVGVLWIYIGLRFHGWYVDEKPGSGFFPTIIGGLLVFVSVLAVNGEFKEEPPKFLKSHLHPFLATVAVVLLALLIGFFPALTLYVLGWVKFYEKYPWKMSVTITIITIAAVYGIFAMWLRVPFPQGWILEMVVN